ncbi:MAG: hypothetical protein ACKOZV_09085, partial [Bacteroidota bacterium]
MYFFAEKRLFSSQNNLTIRIRQIIQYFWVKTNKNSPASVNGADRAADIILILAINQQLSSSLFWCR